jgi:hypothetical protein
VFHVASLYTIIFKFNKYIRVLRVGTQRNGHEFPSLEKRLGKDKS